MLGESLFLLAAVAAAPAGADRPLRDLCNDRPGLGTPACTLDPGHVMAETGLADWTRGENWVFGDLLVRIGVAAHAEVQVGWTAFGKDGHASGTGDVALAVRRNLLSPDGSGTTLAVMPYATLPTGGRAIGAGDWSAGLRIPFGFALSDRVSLAFTPDVEAAVDADRHGRHLAFGSVAGIGVDLTDALEADVELSATRDDDPSGHGTEELAGLSLAWTPGRDLQLDMGANLGLNRAAPGIELYAGISRRF